MIRWFCLFSIVISIILFISLVNEKMYTKKGVSIIDALFMMMLLISIVSTLVSYEKLKNKYSQTIKSFTPTINLSLEESQKIRYSKDLHVSAIFFTRENKEGKKEEHLIYLRGDLRTGLPTKPHKLTHYKIKYNLKTQKVISTSWE